MEQAFEPGRTYFSLMYADRELLIPEIETLVYLGRDKTDDGKPVHRFQHAWSYHNEGNWEEMSAAQRDEFDEPPLLYFDVNECDPICDGDGLVAQLEDWRARCRK